jgi:hypothetical protein
MRVTFDTNTIDRVARTESFLKESSHEDYVQVHDALLAGKIKGFFSETMVTLEGIERGHRVATLGSTQVVTDWRQVDENVISMTIGLKQSRNPLHPKFSERLRAAQSIGMRALRGPARMVVAFTVKDEDGTFFERVEPIEELIKCREKANEVATAIETRGLGRAKALSLGLELSRRDGESGELWLQGLGRAQASEHKKVARVVAEWADGDSIAAHIGYSNEFFCTHDKGMGGGRPLTFDAENRAWLTATYGVSFVTLSDLAAMVG